ncbi:unnamed protein product [Protopolystoma xenopodis]|uniref:Uncharacterized protein n=1 Tax=Protopolystoma xenopodis TaxID=117903 RepID=A0A3S5CS04_9PLAT|nr:unnamed protein product [Protopolystoma xenopodis]
MDTFAPQFAIIVPPQEPPSVDILNWNIGRETLRPAVKTVGPAGQHVLAPRTDEMVKKDRLAYPPSVHMQLESQPAPAPGLASPHPSGRYPASGYHPRRFVGREIDSRPFANPATPALSPTWTPSQWDSQAKARPVEKAQVQAVLILGIA